MIILGVLLLILGSVLSLDARAKQAMIICGIVLLVLGVCLMIGVFGPDWHYRLY